MSDLKPCPFCKGTTLNHQSLGNRRGWCRWLRCDTPGCGATGGYVYDFEFDGKPAPSNMEAKTLVEQRWNSRPAENALQTQVATTNKGLVLACDEVAAIARERDALKKQVPELLAQNERLRKALADVGDNLCVNLMASDLKLETHEAIAEALKGA